MQLALDNIIAQFGTARTRTGCVVTCLLAGLALLAHFYDPPIIPLEYRNLIVTWAAGSLISTAVVIKAIGFVTAEVKNPTCHYCNSKMVTHSLVCSHCGAKSTKKEE